MKKLLIFLLVIALAFAGVMTWAQLKDGRGTAVTEPADAETATTELPADESDNAGPTEADLAGLSDMLGLSSSMPMYVLDGDKLFALHEPDEIVAVVDGVEIPWEKGLLGHSDADVLTHALMDALLGAAGLGDIGHLFPDNDDRFLGADSIELLKEVCRLLAEKNYRVGNVDVTVIAQRPKLAPYIAQMRSRLAAAMQVDESAVNVKATTEEKLGFTGEGLGIAAHAVALIE